MADYPRAGIFSRPGVAAAALVLIAAAFAAWYFLVRDSAEPTGPTTEGATPVDADLADLQRAAEETGHPVFWAGDQAEDLLELTQTSDGRVYVRYLEDAEIDDPSSGFLTVGTYPVENAFQMLQRFAERSGAKIEETPDGGIAVASDEVPGSVYVAHPGEDIQVEVYFPTAEVALELITSGEVQPVPAG